MSDLDFIVEKLAAATVNESQIDENLVTFANRGLKLDSEEDALEIVESIKACDSMTSFCLEGNTIGVLAAKAIGEALECQPKLKKALWKDIFTQRTENEIPEALHNLSSSVKLANAQLTVLDLSDNAFGPRGLKGIIEFLSSAAFFTVEELYLNNNGLGISGAQMLASALSNCLVNSKNANVNLRLKIFQCGRNRLENKGCSDVCDVLKHIRTLQHIAMPQNGIYHEGIKNLSENLSENHNLVSLNLEDNCFTKKGATEMAKLLVALRNIETLNFSDCLIKSDGAEVLADVLQMHCTKLKEINLGYNEICFKSGMKIVKALIEKENLEKLILNGNQFGEKGCDLIQKFISEKRKWEQFGSLSDDEGSESEDEEIGAENEDFENATQINNEIKLSNVVVEENKLNSTNDQESNLIDEIKEFTDIIDKNEPDEFNNNGDEVNAAEECEMNLSDPIYISNLYEDFIIFPTVEKLTKLHELQIENILPFNDFTFQECFEFFAKISSVFDPKSEKASMAAIHFVDIVLSHAFSDCTESDRWKVNSEFILYLGLVKCDDDEIKPVLQNYPSAFVLLNHAAKQKYFHTSMRELLKFLIPKSFKNETYEEIQILMKYLNESVQ